MQWIQASSAEPRSVGKEGVGQTVQSRWEMRREGEDGWDEDGKSSSLREAVREEDGERDAASSRCFGGRWTWSSKAGGRKYGGAVTLLATRRLAHATWAGAGQRGCDRYGQASTEGVSYSRWWRPFSALIL